MHNQIDTDNRFAINSENLNILNITDIRIGIKKPINNFETQSDC